MLHPVALATQIGLVLQKRVFFFILFCVVLSAHVITQK